MDCSGKIRLCTDTRKFLAEQHHHDAAAHVVLRQPFTTATHMQTELVVGQRFMLETVRTIIGNAITAAREKLNLDPPSSSWGFIPILAATSKPAVVPDATGMIAEFHDRIRIELQSIFDEPVCPLDALFRQQDALAEHVADVVLAISTCSFGCSGRCRSKRNGSAPP